MYAVKKIPIARARETLIYDPDETYVLTRRDGVTREVHGSFRRPESGRAVGILLSKTVGSSDFYLLVYIDKKNYMAHRLAWCMHHGRQIPKGYEIDHIDGNSLNNNINNLRAISRAMNMQNQHRAACTNTSGLLGVSIRYDRSKNSTGAIFGYRARIMLDKKETTLGIFPTAELAHAAYVEVKRRLHPGGTL